MFLAIAILALLCSKNVGVDNSQISVIMIDIETLKYMNRKLNSRKEIPAENSSRNYYGEQDQNNSRKRQHGGGT